MRLLLILFLIGLYAPINIFIVLIYTYLVYDEIKEIKGDGAEVQFKIYWILGCEKSWST